MGPALAIVPLQGDIEIVTLYPNAELGPVESEYCLMKPILLQIALTLRCDTTRVLGLQHGTRSFDSGYEANHILCFQYNPVIWKQGNTPWVAIDPPGTAADISLGELG